MVLMATLTPLQQQEKSLQALAVVLQHPAVAADQRNICTLLQVSKTWRTAVQQSAASILDCSLQVQMSFEDINKVIGFTNWLAKHAGLVCSLSVDCQGIVDSGVANSAVQLAAIEQLMEFALQVAAFAGACGSRAPPRLQSYKSFVPATAGLVAALPAATLTYLDLQSGNNNRSDWFTPLSTLTNLRQLCLNIYSEKPGAIASCLQEIGKLQQLTQLQLEGLAVESNTQLLPKQLQQLQLVYQHWFDTTFTEPAHVNLQHLTSLKHLQLKAGRLAPGSSLPVNLQSLGLRAQWPAGGVAGFTSMHRVTAMELSNCTITKEHLEPLLHLRQLRSLSLSLQHHEHTLEVAAEWHSLPLCALRVKAVLLTDSELQQLMQHIAAATRLTKLELKVEEVVAEGDGEDEIAICEQLQALKHLRNLSMNIGEASDFTEYNTEHLSTLVTLTRLELSSRGYGPFVDSATLGCLALSLTGLRALSVYRRCDQYTHQTHFVSALPAIGKLTGLEQLQLQGLPIYEAQRGFRFLTGLSRLTTLGGFEDAGEAALQEFWATVRRQQQGHLQ